MECVSERGPAEPLSCCLWERWGEGGPKVGTRTRKVGSPALRTGGPPGHPGLQTPPLSSGAGSTEAVGRGLRRQPAGRGANRETEAPAERGHTATPDPVRPSLSSKSGSIWVHPSPRDLQTLGADGLPIGGGPRRPGGGTQSPSLGPVLRPWPGRAASAVSLGTPLPPGGGRRGGEPANNSLRGN